MSRVRVLYVLGHLYFNCKGGMAFELQRFIFVAARDASGMTMK